MDEVIRVFRLGRDENYYKKIIFLIINNNILTNI
jgi:hypothetical protein